MKGMTTSSIVAIAALTAFGADGVAAQETWQLAQVNGNALPFVTDTDDDGCREEVTSGTLTLAADDTWRLELTEREVCGNDVDEEIEDEDGRFTEANNAVRFLDDDGDPEDGNDIDDIANATRSGNTLTVTNGDGGVTLVFRD